ncbi:hypothetical protein GQR58_026911 [Nymphon striatum]|nr:hypothetical protein GQR58_026911 [Nymphon striatum]
MKQVGMQENAREWKIREELEAELKEKDAILQDILQKHKVMEETLCELNFTETETKQENMKLQKEKTRLEQNLEDSTKIIDEMRDHTESLRKNSNEDKRNRARAALQATEGIALERETLVRQLDVLKYADDTALIAENENDLQHMIDIVNDIGEDLNMRVNTKKTKYMVVGKDDEHKSKWRGTGRK